MIDFRYHLVSIVAIFLALAIGIVLGTTALNGPVTEGLQRSLTSLNSDANSLRTQNAALQQQVSTADSFAQAAAPNLLGHLLDGQRVVLIAAPGASSQVQHGVSAMLQQSGATISGQIQLQDKFFDTSATTLSYLDQLSQDVKPADLTLVNGTPQQRAAQ
ncbi:MAG: copper transporter, partial [Micromonosporaceae bacterium]